MAELPSVKDNQLNLGASPPSSFQPSLSSSAQNWGISSSPKSKKGEKSTHWRNEAQRMETLAQDYKFHLEQVVTLVEKYRLELQQTTGITKSTILESLLGYSSSILVNDVLKGEPTLHDPYGDLAKLPNTNSEGILKRMTRDLGAKFKRNEKELKKSTDDELSGSDRASNPFLSISTLSPMFQSLPPLKMAPVVSMAELAVLTGPDSETSSTVATFNDTVAGMTISTYPHIPGRSERDGTPICDRFCVQVFENRVIVCIADGCNWGKRPKEAAVNATAAFVSYVKHHMEFIHDVKEIGNLLLKGFAAAHEAIMDGKENYWEAGTTTLLGGVLLEIDRTGDKLAPQWEFICASVGDCKAFAKAGEDIIDVTPNSRKGIMDAKDCGGRLGPHLEGGLPDLRNLNIYCIPCDVGDTIFLVTDGVHDNFDAPTLGINPKDLPRSLNIEPVESWSQLSPEKADKAKNSYMLYLLEDKLRNMNSPDQVVSTLLDYCKDITEPGRKWMEENNGKKLSDDYSKYPGKMDHATVVCFKVGKNQRDRKLLQRQSWHTKMLSSENLIANKNSPTKSWAYSSTGVSPTRAVIGNRSRSPVNCSQDSEDDRNSIGISTSQ